MKHLLRFLSISFLLLSGCSTHMNGDLNFFTDYENLLLFGKNPNALTKIQAYSGIYSTFVDETMEYSVPAETVLGSLGKVLPKSIIIDAQIYSGIPFPDGNVVVSIKREGAKDFPFWNAIPLKQKITAPGRWMHVVEEFNLPNDLQPTDVLIIFLWRTHSKTPIFMDDLAISFKIK